LGDTRTGWTGTGGKIGYAEMMNGVPRSPENGNGIAAPGAAFHVEISSAAE